LGQPSLRSTEQASDRLCRDAEGLRHFHSRMGPLTAQPEVQANDFCKAQMEGLLKVRSASKTR
jgi:hypothetical protein